VIALSEIKHILKKSGDGYKAKMAEAEKETPEAFAHEMAH
jgi:molybdopterin-containing oxidoreductase family membrane subunit